MPKERLEELAFAEYWDRRYEEKKAASGGGVEAELESFEWFKTFEKLRPFFDAHLPLAPSNAHILHLGCGNSVSGPPTLTADLHHAGYSNQTSVDFSAVVIEAMKAKYAGLGTAWEVMDVRALAMEDASVDVAIDKGTLDAFLHGSLWDPPEDVRESVGRYVDEVARVLKPGGSWLYITYRQPHFLKPLLLRDGTWELSVEVLEDAGGGGGFEYFGFVMVRK